MSRRTPTLVRCAVRPSLGALAAACALVLVAEAGARPHFPTTLVLAPFHARTRPSTNPGYLPLVGCQVLRWAEPPRPAPIPAPAPVVLYNPPSPAKPDSKLPASGQSLNSPPGAETAPPLKPKDFLPFFQRDGNAPPGNASPTEGLLFTPARPELPTSSADFRQQ